MTTCLSVSGQVIEQRLKEYVQKESIDSFISYSLQCSGYFLIDSCDYGTPQLLVWKKNEKHYAKKFDYCKTYQAIPLDSINPFTYYINNRAIIDTEEIRQPTYFDVKKRKRSRDTIVVESSISHSCHHTFLISIDKQNIHKVADEYDLQFKEFDNGRRNINYNNNQATKFKVLIELMISVLRQPKPYVEE